MTKKSWNLCAAIVFAWGAALAQGADRGVYTLVEGDVRVLRAATWYRLVPGARAEDGDVIDAAERAQVHLEFSQGGALLVQGPALVYAAALPLSDAKPTMPTEIAMQHGWLKAVSGSKGRLLRLRMANATLDLSDAIVVVHDNSGGSIEFFVEKGSAAVGTPVARGKEPPPREAREGEYWRRTGDRAFETEERPPSAFVSAVPRDLRDAVPSLAGRFSGPPPALAAGREITFAESEPWLAGATRKAFARRLAPRLSDPAFRAAAAARPIPEWDRILHPEKYRPKPDDTTEPRVETGK